MNQSEKMGQEQAIRFFLKDENDIMSITLLRNEIKMDFVPGKDLLKRNFGSSAIF